MVSYAVCICDVGQAQLSHCVTWMDPIDDGQMVW